MGKLGLIWGLIKVVAPVPVAKLAYAGRRRIVAGRLMDAKAQAVSDLVAKIRGVDVMPTLSQSRAQLDAMAAKFDLPCPASVTRKDVTLEGAFGPRPARLYVPNGKDPEAPQPTLLYLHGGGWVQGSIASHDGLCGKLSEVSGLRIISYDYVLAPEHKFPDLNADVLAAYRSLLAGAFGVTGESLSLGGDSAGANLTAALLHDLQDAGEALPKAQLLIYPSVDARLTSQSNQDLATQPLLPRARIDWFLEHYLPEGQDRLSPRLSPLFSPHLAGQPPAYVIGGGHDPLWDDALAYANALEAAGVRVTRDLYLGQVHAFLSLRKVLPDGVKATEKAGAWLREVHAS
ncbi:MAG: alpha/beta hydrolase fold domain-containing protein [Maritimibacter sp.]